MPRPISKIWDHFELINTDGKKTARCNFCRKHLGNNATKLRQHLENSCKQCPNDFKVAFEDIPRGDTSQAASHFLSVSSSQLAHSPIFVPTPSSANDSLSPCSFSRALQHDQQSNGPPDNTCMTPEKNKEIDLCFARAIYATGTPFNLLESSFWQKAIAALNPTYTVPSRNSISTSLLDSEYERVRKGTLEIINRAEALVLVMDGWTDINGKGTVKFIVTTPKPFFYKSVYPGSNRENAVYLFTQMKALIDEIGPSKFVAVVTDNTITMKATWRMVEAEYEHIFAVGCASHTLNLLLRDIVKIQKIKDCIDIVTKIIKYIKKRHVELTYFEKIQTEKYGNNKKTLKLTGQTRSGGNYITMMESLLCNREALKATVTCQEINFDRELTQHILTEDLWISVNALHNILKPIFVATTNLESNEALLSQVPEMFEYIRENVYNALSTCELIDNEVERLIIELIGNKQHLVEKPIHYAANILDPKFMGLKLTPAKVAKGQEFIHRYAEIQHKNAGKVMANLAEYRSRSGFYSQVGIWAASDQVEARTWWKGLCDCQILASIAIQLLSIPPSSAASERNWSLFGNTSTCPRNIITTDRLQKLITVRSNIRLLSDNPNDNVYMADDEEYVSSNSHSEDEGEGESVVQEQDNIPKVEEDNEQEIMVQYF
ncbi:uncharacterized protein LOC121734420 [Aricia agestis]|uniref:uncharacterized protein LOC121734420 n=1 Tax=Aricia agestis TaxID=91739 RepID=UPI001C209026|nr:uncharacterized protein LOC121734420 [Aricia agestis]